MTKAEAERQAVAAKVLQRLTETPAERRERELGQRFSDQVDAWVYAALMQGQLPQKEAPKP